MMAPEIEVCHVIFGQFQLSSPLSHFVTHPETPPIVRHTSRTPRFLVGLVQKIRTKAPCTNSISIVREGFCPGLLSGDLLSGRFCPGWFLSVLPSVRIHLLQHKVKNHFKFHVSYV